MNNMKKEFEELEKRPHNTHTPELFNNNTQESTNFIKHLAMMTCKDPAFKISHS